MNVIILIEFFHFELEIERGKILILKLFEHPTFLSKLFGTYTIPFLLAHHFIREKET